MRRRVVPVKLPRPEQDANDPRVRVRRLLLAPLPPLVHPVVERPEHRPGLEPPRRPHGEPHPVHREQHEEDEHREPEVQLQHARRQHVGQHRQHHAPRREHPREPPRRHEARARVPDLERAEEEVGRALLDPGHHAHPPRPVPPRRHPREEAPVARAAEPVAPEVDAARGGEGGGDLGHGEGDDEGEAGMKLGRVVRAVLGTMNTHPPIMVQLAKAALGPPVVMAKPNSTGIPETKFMVM